MNDGYPPIPLPSRLYYAALRIWRAFDRFTLSREASMTALKIQCGMSESDAEDFLLGLRDVLEA